MKLKWFSASGQGGPEWTFFLVLLAVPLFGDVLKHEIEIETINTKSMIYNIIGDTDFIYGLNVNKFVQDVDIFV